MGYTDWFSTYMLVTDAGRTPDWAAGRAYIDDVPDEDLKKAGAFEYLLPTTSSGEPLGGGEDDEVLTDEAAARACRDMLKDRADEIAGAHAGAVDKSSLDYEVRRVRGADAHILYDYAPDPTGLWPAADALEFCAPGWFGAVGFDVEEEAQ